MRKASPRVSPPVPPADTPEVLAEDRWTQTSARATPRARCAAWHTCCLPSCPASPSCCFCASRPHSSTYLPPPSWDAPPPRSSRVRRPSPPAWRAPAWTSTRCVPYSPSSWRSTSRKACSPTSRPSSWRASPKTSSTACAARWTRSSTASRCRILTAAARATS